MYDAPPQLTKDYRDDALGWLHRAAGEAKTLGLTGEVRRLEGRRSEILAVFDRQFRNAGR